jgi:hypothetical protein
MCLTLASEQAVDSKKCSEGLRSFLCADSCDLSVKDNTDILYAIYKWDVQSVKCKMRFDQSTAATEIEGPSYIVIILHVPALIPWLHRTEAALQLSQNTALFKACAVYTCDVSKRGLDEHLMTEGHHLYINCARLEKKRGICGSPVCWVLFERNELVRLIILSEIVILVTCTRVVTVFLRHVHLKVSFSPPLFLKHGLIVNGTAAHSPAPPIRSSCPTRHLLPAKGLYNVPPPKKSATNMFTLTMETEMIPKRRVILNIRRRSFKINFSRKKKKEQEI